MISIFPPTREMTKSKGLRLEVANHEVVVVGGGKLVAKYQSNEVMERNK